MSAENSTKNSKRKVGRPFKAGQSGNPGGRPKKHAPLVERCRSIVDDQVVDAWAEEVRKHGPDWVACSKLLAAYGYGRPIQALAVDASGVHAFAVMLEKARERAIEGHVRQLKEQQEALPK